MVGNLCQLSPSLTFVTIWITQRQAAEILGVGPSAVPKMVGRSKLHPRRQAGKEPTLDLTEVEALRDRREAAVRTRATRHDREVSRQRTPPDDDHVWLSVPEAAELLGISRQAVNVRARKDQLSSVMKGDRRWIRRDLLEMSERARAVSRGEEPPAWTWRW